MAWQFVSLNLLAYAAGEFWAAGRYQEVPFSAATVLQQIGILLVFACTGSESSPHFFDVCVTAS